MENQSHFNDHQLLEFYALENNISLIDIILLDNQRDNYHNVVPIDRIEETELAKGKVDMMAIDNLVPSDKNMSSSIASSFTSQNEEANSYVVALNSSVKNLLEDSKHFFLQVPPFNSHITFPQKSLTTESPLNDLEIYHLFLQIKHFPTFRLLQYANKIVTSVDWKFAKKEMEMIKLIRNFEMIKEKGLTDAYNDEKSVKKLSNALQSPLMASTNGRRRPSHWDFLLEEMEWMSIDYREERRWKMKKAKHLAQTLKEFVNKKNGVALLEEKDSTNDWNLTCIPSQMIKTKCPDYNSIEEPIDLSVPLSFYYLDSPKIDNNTPIYGPPNPYSTLRKEMITFTGELSNLPREDAPEIFNSSSSRSCDYRIKTGIFSHNFVNTPKDYESTGSDNNAPEKDDFIKTGNLKGLMTITDNLSSPWLPIEDQTLISTMETFVDPFVPPSLTSTTQDDALPAISSVDWNYLAEFINTHFYHGKFIRNGPMLMNRYLKLTKLLQYSNSVKKEVGAFRHSRIMSDDDKKKYSLKEFEQLMLTFTLIKKRQRSKALVKSVPAQLSKKALLTAHPSHESTIKKIASVYPKICTPSELALRKAQRLRVMISESTPNLAKGTNVRPQSTPGPSPAVGSVGTSSQPTSSSISAPTSSSVSALGHMRMVGHAPPHGTHSSSATPAPSTQQISQGLVSTSGPTGSVLPQSFISHTSNPATLAQHGYPVFIGGPSSTMHHSTSHFVSGVTPVTSTHSGHHYTPGGALHPPTLAHPGLSVHSPAGPPSNMGTLSHPGRPSPHLSSATSSGAFGRTLTQPLHGITTAPLMASMAQGHTPIMRNISNIQGVHPTAISSVSSSMRPMQPSVMNLPQRMTVTSTSPRTAGSLSTSTDATSQPSPSSLSHGQPFHSSPTTSSQPQSHSQAQIPPPSHPQSQSQIQPQPQPSSQIQSHAKQQQSAHPPTAQPQLHTQPQSQPQSQSQTQLQMPSQLQTQTQSQPLLFASSHPQMHSFTQPQLHLAPPSQTSTMPQTHSRSQQQPPTHPHSHTYPTTIPQSQNLPHTLLHHQPSLSQTYRPSISASPSPQGTSSMNVGPYSANSAMHHSIIMPPISIDTNTTVMGIGSDAMRSVSPSKLATIAPRASSSPKKPA